MWHEPPGAAGRADVVNAEVPLHELDGAPEIGESGGADDTVEAGRNSSQVQPWCAWP